MPKPFPAIAPAIALATAAAALAACAPVDEEFSTADEALTAERLAAEGGSCFFARNVTGYREAPDGPDGEERVLVEVGADETYLFETFGPCPNLDFTRRLGFDQQGVGRICSGIDVDLIVPDRALGPQRCPVRMVSRVEDEEGAR